MKEQESIQTPQDLQSEQTMKKIPIEKKRKIRKQKIQLTVIDFSDLKNIDTKKLTKEERAKVQKVKNRQAAQRSRDMHRQQFMKMKKEVEEFRELKKDSRNLCWRCKLQLQENHNPYINYQNQQIEENKQIQSNNFLFENSELNNHLQLPVRTNTSGIFQDDSFIRVQEDSFNSNCSFIGTFVVAVCLIICVSFLYTPRESSRALMEVASEGTKIQGLSTETLKKMEERIKFQGGDKNINKTAVVKVESIEEHGLIALHNDDCIKSLMKVEAPSVPVQNSLTSYSDPTYSQKPNLMNQNEGILLCQLRMPKPYSPKLSQIRTPLVRLYLLGSQIKDLISNFNLMIPVMDGDNIQTNGIYQVLARIKEVNKVTNHNCLL